MGPYLRKEKIMTERHTDVQKAMQWESIRLLALIAGIGLVMGLYIFTLIRIIYGPQCMHCCWRPLLIGAGTGIVHLHVFLPGEAGTNIHRFRGAGFCGYMLPYLIQSLLAW